MTKAELLVDLEARDGIAALVGDPVDVTPSPGDVGVIASYDQAVLERRGNAGLKKSIRFYVLDEGEVNEEAFYKDSEPQTSPDVNQNALYSWMRTVIDVDPDSYKAAQIHYVSERWEMVVYSILEGAPELEWNTYYVRRGEGAPVKISNHSPEFLQSIFRV